MLDRSDQRLHSLAARPARAVVAANLSLLPDAAKLSFRGRSESVAAASRAFGIELPTVACRFTARDHRSAFWLGPDEWMLVATGENPDDLYGQMSQMLQGQSCSLVDVSHRSDGFSLSGPRSAYVLNHGCPLDLSLAAFPVGMCTRTIIGKASVLLSRPADETFHIDVWRSFAPYVWQLLDDARGELA